MLTGSDITIMQLQLAQSISLTKQPEMVVAQPHRKQDTNVHQMLQTAVWILEALDMSCRCNTCEVL